MPDLTWKMALLDHQEKPILATLICTQNFNLISQTISDIRLSQKIQTAVTTILNSAESSNVHQMWPVMTSFLWEQTFIQISISIPEMWARKFSTTGHLQPYIIQMMHGCKWNIQICCPEVEMSSLGLRHCDDMSTSGQHIWMFHLQPCIICIM